MSWTGLGAARVGQKDLTVDTKVRAVLCFFSPFLFPTGLAAGEEKRVWCFLGWNDGPRACSHSLAVLMFPLGDWLRALLYALGEGLTSRVPVYDIAPFAAAVFGGARGGRNLLLLSSRFPFSSGRVAFD